MSAIDPRGWLTWVRHLHPFFTHPPPFFTHLGHPILSYFRLSLVGEWGLLTTGDSMLKGLALLSRPPFPSVQMAMFTSSGCAHRLRATLL